MALRTPNTNGARGGRIPVLRETSAARRGFTLAESLVASIILAIAVLGVCNAIVAAQKQLDMQEEDTTAIALGRQLMEQASALPLVLVDATPGWPTVTSSGSYDTISDFAGYTDAVTIPIRRSGNLSDAGSFSTAAPSATPVTGARPTLSRQQYIREVSVTYPTSMFGAVISPGDMAVVTVTVTGGGGNSTKLSRIFARNTLQR